MGSVRDACSWLHVGLPSGAVSSAPAASGGGAARPCPGPHARRAPPPTARPLALGRRPGALRPAGYPHRGHSKRGEVTRPFRSVFMGMSAAHVTPPTPRVCLGTRPCVAGQPCLLAGPAAGRERSVRAQRPSQQRSAASGPSGGIKVETHTGGGSSAVTAPSPPRRSGRDLNAAGATALALPFPKRGPRQGQQLRGPPASLWHLGTWRRVPGCPIAATSGVRAWGQTPWRSATLDKLLDHCRVPQRPRL